MKRMEDRTEVFYGIETVYVDFPEADLSYWDNLEDAVERYDRYANPVAGTSRLVKLTIETEYLNRDSLPPKQQ